MAIAKSDQGRGVAALAPSGGISAQLGEKSFALVLRNGEIERFERHVGVGIFQMLEMLLENQAMAHHCRDLVALGLVGGGLTDSSADAVIADLPPQSNIALRGVARELLFSAFADPQEGRKKKDEKAGSPNKEK